MAVLSRWLMKKCGLLERDWDWRSILRVGWEKLGSDCK